MRAGNACVLWLLLLAGLSACGQVGTQVLSQPDTPAAVAPSIATQPVDQSIKVGDAATFSVVATGSVPLFYQWHKNGAAIAGATATSYTTPAAAPDNDGDAYAVIITNPAGSTASSSARLSVTASAIAPAITSEPNDASITAGQSATFSVVATGTSPLSYQWQKSGTAIAGASSASYTTPAEGTADNGATFAVVVSNSAGSATSRAAKLNVGAAGGPVAPSITVQPSDQSIAAGHTATYSVTATGTAPLSYQWQKNGTAVAGATSASYTTPAETTADSGASFAVVVSNSAGSVTSRGAKLNVAAAGGPVAPSITVQPADQSIRAGQTATYSVTATGTAPLTYQWQRNGTVIAGATSASYTTPTQSTTDNGATFAVVVRNSAGSATSRSARLSVTSALTQGTDVVTYKNDLARTGQNLRETVLTLANVKASTFGKLRFLSTDGKVDAQPLYLSALSIGGATHNVLFVVTENDSVYAFDADSGALLWHVSVLPAGETVSDLPPYVCDQTVPTIGITATPVIDRGAGAHGVIYLVAMSKANSAATYHHRLHALDVTTGAEVFNGPVDISASYPSSGGTFTFDPSQYQERAALLLANGAIYTSFTSHCDVPPYSGWIIAYNQTTLARSAVLNVAPNSGGGGPAIWMSGGGPAADAAGNVYLLTANGAFETTLDVNGFPNQHDYGNSFLKLSTTGGTLSVADYFTMYNEVIESSADIDLGSGGAMLLPDLTDAGGTVRHLAVGAGKDGNIYVVNRDSMGRFSASGNNIWQQLTRVLGNGDGTIGGIWSTPAYFNGTVYYGVSGGNLTAFTFTNARLSASPSSVGAVRFTYPGASPAISANGTSNGIVWAYQNSYTPNALLYAFDASNLGRELYDSSQAANNRDQLGPGNKFITPTIADGKVFVGMTNGVAVFGLLP